MSLPKSKRLKSRTSIDQLFDKRRNVRKQSVKLIYNYVQLPEGDGPEYLFTVVVPKKLIKTAVKRTLIKRRIREAFRLNQSLLNGKIHQGKQLHMMIVFTYTKVQDYPQIEENIISVLKRL